MSCINCGCKVTVLLDSSVSSHINGHGHCSACATKKSERLQATVNALENKLRISMSKEDRKVSSNTHAAIPQHEDYTPNEFVDELLAEKDTEIAKRNVEIVEAKMLLRGCLPFIEAIHKSVNSETFNEANKTFLNEIRALLGEENK